MSNLYIEPSIDASYQISDQLALRFQRRRLKCEKLTDDRRRMPSDGKSSHCLWQGELKKGCTRLAVASDKVYQLLAHGWWFSQGIPASSTTKTGHYDIAEILLKVASNQINQKLFSEKNEEII
jgi:hypothetical protein